MIAGGNSSTRSAHFFGLPDSKGSLRMKNGIFKQPVSRQEHSKSADFNRRITPLDQFSVNVELYDYNSF